VPHVEPSVAATVESRGWAWNRGIGAAVAQSTVLSGSLAPSNGELGDQGPDSPSRLCPASAPDPVPFAFPKAVIRREIEEPRGVSPHLRLTVRRGDHAASTFISIAFDLNRAKRCCDHYNWALIASRKPLQ
jgi:hypothetical protein